MSKELVFTTSVDGLPEDWVAVSFNGDAETGGIEFRGGLQHVLFPEDTDEVALRIKIRRRHIQTKETHEWD